MKKVLRFLLILIVILFVGYVVLCIATPAEMDIVKSTTIKGSKDVVWNQMVNLENQTNWSPWEEMDPSIKSTITGAPGQVGQKSSWTSKNSGDGEMVISRVEGDSMWYDLDFKGQGKAYGWVAVEEVEGGVKASNGFRSEPASFWKRGMIALIGKRFMEMQLARGLEMLKEHVESGKAEVPAPAYVIEEYTFPATSFATIRKTIKMNEMDSFMHQSDREIKAAAGSQIKGNKHIIAYTWDEAKGETDIAMAYPVNGPVKGLSMLDIPESKGYKLVLIGAYTMENFQNAHGAIGKHAGDNGLTDPLMMEEYIIGPEQEADSNKWVTNIYYLHK